MDKRLKPGTTFQHRHGENSGSNSTNEDRLSSLPTGLLIYLLSFLPTKDAAAICILSRRLCRVFPLLTTLDFDATHIRHCFAHPSAIQHFPSFVSFVNAVLCSSQSRNLTKFRLRVGVDFSIRNSWDCHSIDSNCLPDLKSSQVNAWISFPLTRLGLTELDIRLPINEPGDAQLPPEIFTCESLEVLKLDVNLGFPLVSTFRLPNLKLCHLRSSLFSEEDFLSRLVSSCPLLEDFSLVAYCDHLHCVRISSPSLRRLHLTFYRSDDDDDDDDIWTDDVIINAPNLEYLSYLDNLALQYSVQNMPHLVNAVIRLKSIVWFPPYEVHNRQVFNLIRPLSNAQELSLLTRCIEALHFADVKEEKLPVFPNLKCLQLGYDGHLSWDRVLLLFLNRSPVLETLVFPQGLDRAPNPASISICRKELLDSEEKFFRETQTVPQCCRVHLKRIVIKKFYGSEREVYLIQFLLRQSYVLQELVISRELCRVVVPDKKPIEDKLNMLPRASHNCSIQMLR